MGQVIAVVSGKGGTGKTSFTALVGSALAEMGHRTLCLDCDVGLRNLDLALGMSDSALMAKALMPVRQEVLLACCRPKK